MGAGFAPRGGIALPLKLRGLILKKSEARQKDRDADVDGFRGLGGSKPWYGSEDCKMTPCRRRMPGGHASPNRRKEPVAKWTFWERAGWGLQPRPTPPRPSSPSFAKPANSVLDSPPSLFRPPEASSVLP